MTPTNALNSARALVAGGAGFLGSHLCRKLLDQGMEVVCLDSLTTGRLDNIQSLRGNRRFTHLVQDITQPFSIDGPVDEIYNLACAASPPHYQDAPIHTLLTSVVGTHRLLELAEQKGARLLQASTSEVYGDALEHPQSESYLGNVNCTGPRACYDEGKRAGEALCFDFQRLGRADVRVARIFNTYGPHMRADDGRIVSNLITQALCGKDLTIYGNGRQTRSFCYVDDLVEGLVRLMRVERNPDGPVNLGNPAEFQIVELATLVLELTGSSSRMVRRPLPKDDPRQRRPDISRARKLLGWSPSTSVEAGLLRTIDWFRRSLPVEAVQAPPKRRYRSGDRGATKGRAVRAPQPEAVWQKP